MCPAEPLVARLRALTGRDYAAYQSLRGEHVYDRFRLRIDRIPKDPYAPPGTGTFCVSVSRGDAGLPDYSRASRVSCVAFRDFLARRFYAACKESCAGRRGTGNSGLITIAEPGQEILDRTSVYMDQESIEVRFFIGLPAKGRSIDAETARTMLAEELPRIVESALFAANVDLRALERHVHTAEDAEQLRARLSDLGLVAFIADGAILPRASGIDPRPLGGDTVVPFASPSELRVGVDLPHAGTITGLGIPEGVTLIVGGGYHGKSTLLEALELGIYDHVPGDGRELCVSVSQTVKIRAASGRSVANADISAFINHLPLGDDTTAFSTPNASGSTSQAAFIAESIESGARALLMDEDTCAANFMIRDGRMQRLVARDQEPITAFVDTVGWLHKEMGVSTVLVMGGSGDYLDVADRVIQMADFRPRDVTESAREIAEALPTRQASEGNRLRRPRDRAPDGVALDPCNEYGHFHISARDPHHVAFGRMEIDLSDVEQITEIAQARAIGCAMQHAKTYMDGRTPLREVVARVAADVDENGLDILQPERTGDLAGVRGLDIAAALNRVRDLVFHQVG